MARYAHEIMNAELFSVEPEAGRQDTLEFLLLLGITACPVIDEAGKVLGMIGVRDLVSEDGGGQVRRRISEPAVTIGLEATIEDVGRRLSEYHARSVIVQDDKGRAVGIVSAIDLVSALLGLPVVHPKGFPHIDASGEVAWSAEATLEPENSESVQDGPGVIALIHAVRGEVDVPVWIEGANNLRARVDDLISSPQDVPALAYILARDHGHLHFRTAAIQDPDLRQRTVERMRAQLRRYGRMAG